MRQRHGGEAQYVLDMIDQYGWNVSMPIIMDREAGANKRLTAGKLSKTKETAVCQAFADTITAAGYRAGVYASYVWIKNYINTDTLYDCSLWMARYNNTTTSNAKSGHHMRIRHMITNSGSIRQKEKWMVIQESLM